MAQAAIYRNMVQQATLASYMDDFRLLAYLSLLCIPFLIFFRNPGKSRKREVALPHGSSRWALTDEAGVTSGG